MCARALLLLYMVIAVRRKAEALSLIGRGGFRRVAVSGTGAMEGERARERKREGDGARVAATYVWMLQQGNAAIYRVGRRRKKI